VPFAGKNIGEQCALLLRTTPPAPSAIAPRSIPPGLDEVVMRALSAEPDHRGPDVSVLARGLAPFGGPDAAQSLQRIERTLAHRGRGTLPSLNELPSQTAAEVPDELARMLVQADAIPNPRSRDRDVDQTGPTVASTKRSAQAPAGMMSDDSTRRLARSIQIEEAAALEGGGGPSMSQSTRASWGTSHKLEPKRPSKTRLVLAAALSVAVGAGVALVILTRAAGGPDVQSAAQDDGQPAEPLVATEQIAAADEPAEAAPQPSEHESDDAAAAAPSVAVSASATSASASASPATVSTAPPKAGAPSPRPAVRPAAPLPPPKAAPSPTPAPKPNGSDPFGDGRM
jgi:hypothetical protein